jgi:hypothetical protein
LSGGVPAYSHIVVVVEENKNYDDIDGNPDAPYINSLMTGGANLTNFDALAHPSPPNYFALYAGSTFGATDDNMYSEPDPTLYTALKGAASPLLVTLRRRATPALAEMITNDACSLSINATSWASSSATMIQKSSLRENPALSQRR